MARFPVLKSLCILSVFLFSTGSYSAVIDIRQAPAVTTAPETCLPAALTPLTSLHFHRSSSTTVSLVDRRATTTTVLPPAIFDRRAPAPTTVEGLDDGTKEELKDSMKYYNEFLEFRVGHKGPLSGQSGFRGGLPIPGVTTPTPYVTLAARSLPLCRGQAFDPHTRYCHHNEATGVSILCPVHDGVRYLGCGNGCYHPKAYYCENEDSPNARIVQRNSFVPRAVHLKDGGQLHPLADSPFVRIPGPGFQSSSKNDCGVSEQSVLSGGKATDGKMPVEQSKP